ncbi:MAG: hypothetical protein LBT74_02415 [Acidobacteriota bacterium]|jgi:hypothetical protein|nr:hypothetical protein [Acidobacteriota bacterium]
MNELAIALEDALTVNELAAEFEDVLKGYVRVAADFSRIVQVDDDGDPQALIQSILDNRGCLEEIQQINQRMVRLYDAWERSRADADAADRREIGGIVEAVRAQAQELEKICVIKAQKVEARRNQLAQELQDVGKGSRYLKLLKPAQQNYPKFIDSTL